MGIFIAKLKNDESWYKLKDGETATYYEDINLNDAMNYNPDNTLAGQWFKYSLDKNSVPSIFSNEIDSVNLNSLVRNQYKNIEIIAYYHNSHFYIQNVTTGSYLSKKWFAWDGDVVKYQERDDIIFINPMPNCIYSLTDKTVYFMDISKAYSLFKFLKIAYKEATREETERMLSSDIIEAHNFTYDKVGVQNRKRIKSVIDIYESYDTAKKNSLKIYISNSIGNRLQYNMHTKKFKIETDNQLRLLLFGIQKRFYKALFETETKVATSVAKLSDIT